MKICIENIGPFDNLDKNIECKGATAIFARNGSGKTFISRCFRMFSLEQHELNNYAEKLIKKGTENSKFEYEYKSGDKTNRIDFTIKNHIVSNINDDKSSIFYVFNSDYVEENLYAKNYQPDGSIEGIILGKNNIDLTKEKDELLSLINERTVIKEELSKKITEIKDELKKVGVSASMNAFKSITIEEVTKSNNKTKDNYELAFDNCSKVSDIPDDINTVSDINNNVKIDFVSEINTFLSKEFSLSSFEDEFVSSVKNKYDFIEKGVELAEGSLICPFCGNKLNDEANELIHKYTLFINDEQTKAIKKAATYKVKIDNIKTQLKDLKLSILQKKSEIEKVSNYITDVKLFDKDVNSYFDDVFNKLKLYEKCLDNKINDISKNCLGDGLNLDNVYSCIDELCDELSTKIKDCNGKLENIKSIKTEKRRELCEEALNKITYENNASILNIQDLNTRINNLENTIKEKELTNSIDKKSSVSKSLSNYVERVFGKKYKFNENKFEISLGDELIGNNAKFVLSDGEKSAFAFIHYLSNVHSIIDTIDDYKKIVFIIDDPVSSMDFQYLYEILSNIRLIKDDLKIDMFRSILFTHNLEFFSSLIRNKIYSCSLILHNGSLDKFDKNLIMPYEFHLQDILDALNERKVAHTIPNSIRHIIETMCQFEGIAKDSNGMNSFIQENEEFRNKEYVYSFMQDLSHGNIRYELSYTEDQILDACDALINLVKRKYPHQLD